MRAYQPSPAASTPGDRAGGEEAEQRPAGERRADGEPHADRASRAAAAGSRRPRSCVGVAAYTSRTVSLNCRTLAKPAANATSAKVRSVVSISTRAVCARRARASASGPAPSSAVSSRVRWRGV